MRKIACFFIMILVGNFSLSGQELEQKSKLGIGQFELGIRSSGSFFNNANSLGRGIGGQFRIRFLKRLNTEWYADFFTANIDNIGTRKDAHIGWSIMMYPFNTNKVKGKFTPYIIVGNCFDKSKVYENNRPENEQLQYSAALQFGLGTSYNLTDNLDLTLTCQYMNHIGGSLRTKVEGVTLYDKTLLIEKSGKTTIDGHLLLCLSINATLIDFWKKAKQ